MQNALNYIKSKISVSKLNIGLLVFLTAFLLYTLFAPITPAVYKNLNITNPNAVVAGHTLDYTIDSCRRVGESVVTTITRSLISTTNPNLLPIPLSTDVVTNPPRCNHAKRTVLLPYAIPAGNYRLVVRGSYAILPLRSPVSVEIKSAPFPIQTLSTEQQIQELIDANNLLQAKLNSQGSSTNSSTSTVTKTTHPNGTSTTTNNTTTNNSTTNNSSQPSNGTTSQSSSDPGLVNGVLNILGGGIDLIL